MTVTELQGDGIVADATQSGDGNPGESSRAVATPTLPKDVDLSHILGARRKLTEKFGTETLLTAIFPGDGYEITNDLKVSRRPHGPKLRPVDAVASRERTAGRP